MTLKHDKILIVDIEATCWEDNKNPPGVINEIIEVGACLLDTHSLELSDKSSILVRPEFSFISPFCTQLTSITPEMVERDGVSFADACAMIEKRYTSRGRLWVSWGNYDRKMFQAQCKTRDIRYPFSDHHMNARKVFGYWMNNKHQIGMAQAFEKLELPLEGTHHRGDDDAWNIGRLLQVVLKTHGIGVLAKYW